MYTAANNGPELRRLAERNGNLFNTISQCEEFFTMIGLPQVLIAEARNATQISSTTPKKRKHERREKIKRKRGSVSSTSMDTNLIDNVADQLATSDTKTNSMHIEAEENVTSSSTILSSLLTEYYNKVVSSSVKSNIVLLIYIMNWIARIVVICVALYELVL